MHGRFDTAEWVPGNDAARIAAPTGTHWPPTRPLPATCAVSSARADWCGQCLTQVPRRELSRRDPSITGLRPGQARSSQ
jgi:hypothetical protein